MKHILETWPFFFKKNNICVDIYQESHILPHKMQWTLLFRQKAIFVWPAEILIKICNHKWLVLGRSLLHGYDGI